MTNGPTNKPGINLDDKIQILRGGREYMAKGEIEFVIKDKFKRVIRQFTVPNLIKIFSKEMLAHRLGPTRVWDPTASSGVGAWVDSGIDVDEDFSVKYIMFGASFDTDGVALGTNDSRFYTIDTVTSTPVPIRLEPGAEFDGGLINPVPISEPDRPLKRIENIDFEASYQPSGTPLLQADVRALNNMVLYETTLELDEYNGLGLTGSDSFTISEVALVGGKELDTVGACDCDPHELFLEGTTDGDAFLISFSGGDTVTIDSDEVTADLTKIKAGDQVKIVDAGDTAGDSVSLDQASDYYLVVAKSATGRELTLDRTPVNTSNVPLTGSAGLFRDTMRIFSHRILPTPVVKNNVFEILVRWRIIFS